MSCHCWGKDEEEANRAQRLTIQHDMLQGEAGLTINRLRRCRILVTSFSQILPKTLRWNFLRAGAIVGAESGRAELARSWKDSGKNGPTARIVHFAQPEAFPEPSSCVSDFEEIIAWPASREETDQAPIIPVSVCYYPLAKPMLHKFVSQFTKYPIF